MCLCIRTFPARGPGDPLGTSVFVAVCEGRVGDVFADEVFMQLDFVQLCPFNSLVLRSVQLLLD
uniref:Uncharacterized protein n=1 Tax=Anguilla anguilla TaxID=7936 RepID=A0A0E9WZY0_ANGAN